MARVLTPVWNFFNQLIPLYVWNIVYGIPLEYLDDNLVPKEDPKNIP